MEKEKKERIINMKEWNIELYGEPTVKDLLDTIQLDLQSGVRFYNKNILEELKDSKDIMNNFIFGEILGDILIRFPSDCDYINQMGITEFIDFCKNNITLPQKEIILN